MKPTDELHMTTTACDKINIFAEGKVTFKSLIFDPDSQPLGQFNKHGQAAEIISPVNATYKSTAVGDKKNHGVKASLIKKAVEGASMFDEADNDNRSCKSATEVTVMKYNTATLKSVYSLKDTVNIENEVPPEEHDDHDQAEMFEDMKVKNS